MLNKKKTSCDWLFAGGLGNDPSSSEVEVSGSHSPGRQLTGLRARPETQETTVRRFRRKSVCLYRVVFISQTSGRT